MTDAVNVTANVPRKKNPKQLDGDQQLRRIARAGRQWKNTIGRKVDMESQYFITFLRYYPNGNRAAYVYRLCIEWARLWADDRDAMSYGG